MLLNYPLEQNLFQDSMAKQKKTEELRGLSAEDLFQKQKGLKKELFDLYYQRKVGRVEKPHRFKEIRKNIARMMTVIREKEI